MNYPDPGNDRQADEPVDQPTSDRSAIQARLRSTRPRPARFSAAELVQAASAGQQASRPPAVPDRTRWRWVLAIAASWLFGMITGAAALHLVQGRQLARDRATDVGEPPDGATAGGGVWAAAPRQSDADDVRTPDDSSDEAAPPANRRGSNEPIDRRLSEWFAPTYAFAGVAGGEPLRAISIRRTGAPAPPAWHRPASEPVGPARPPLPPATGPISEDAAPLTPASYRGRLWHLLESPHADLL